MNDNGVYESPKADLHSGERREVVTTQTLEVIQGQKLVLYAILILMASVVLSMVVHEYFVYAGFISTILGIVGITKMAAGLGYGASARVLFIVGVLVPIPLLRLLLLLYLNDKATKFLRQNGYRIGLFGARQ